MSRRRGLPRQFRIWGWVPSPGGLVPEVAQVLTAGELNGGLGRGEIVVVGDHYEFRGNRNPHASRPKEGSIKSSMSMLKRPEFDAVAERGRVRSIESIGQCADSRVPYGLPEASEREAAVIKLHMLPLERPVTSCAWPRPSAENAA